MKRFLLSILMVVIGLSAFSQSPSRIITLQPSYPLMVGQSNAGDIEFSSNGLYLLDTPLDSLPLYEIGEIGTQTVRYSEEGYGFFVKADSLHSLNVVYSYEVNEVPNGTITFNETSGRFKYYPAADDYQPFMVRFSATNGVESVSEDVEFRLMPQLTPEATVYHSLGVMPDASDYTVVAEASKAMFLNNQERTAYSISISGKDVVFDNAVQNKVWGLKDREDIYELNIYAERLIVRSALSFPQAKITVYAKELIFEDQGQTVASINTTPSKIEILSDGEGWNGANAGNITLYIKEFKGNLAKRFILCGANGQNTNRNGTPGKGGNGGVVTSTIDVSSYCDFARGSGGVKYDADANAENNLGPVIAYGENGNTGSVKLVNRPYAYLHPYYISAVMRHVNDAFVNNQTEYVMQTCREYRTLIEESLGLNHVDNKEDGDGSIHEGIIDDVKNLFIDSRANRSLEDDIFDLIDGGNDNDNVGNSVDDSMLDYRLELRSELTEISSMLYNLEMGLDYFGNSAGWVPLLSFEVYLANYNNEIDRAIPTLYMYYWLNRIDQTLQHKIEASQFAADATEQELKSNFEELTKLVAEVPVLQDEAEAITAMIDDLTARLEKLQAQLLKKAKHNVKKRNRIKKIFGIVRAVANVLPVTGPVGAAIGSGLNVALDAVNTFSNYAGLVDLTTKIDDSQYKTSSAEMQQYWNDLKNGVAKKDLDVIKTAGDNFSKALTPLVQSIGYLQGVLSKSSSSKSDVQAEYNKLIAKSKTWKKLKTEIEVLNNRKENLINHMNDVFANMTSTVSDLNSCVLAYDAFKRDVFVGNSKRDLNAMLYFEKMQQRAKNRLQKYDYYLRKAYEYRMLKPYEGEEFNLVGMYERAERLGMALDSVVSEASYNTLSSIFKERISDMVERIIDEYTYSQPGKETNRPVSLTITKEQLDEINANGSVTLNLFEMGRFPEDRENIRIVDLGIKYIKAHTEGNVGDFSDLHLKMKHSGISQYLKGGQTYWFNHTGDPHEWETQVEDVYGSIEKTDLEADQVSGATSSLLSSIVGNKTDDILLFSRPSAWSDITMSKQIVSGGGGDIIIDSLMVSVKYEYTKRSGNYHIIDVAANNGLTPYIACSEEDNNHRSGGIGHIFRVFKTSKDVTFTAQKQYEECRFVNWTDRYGNVVSEDVKLMLNTSTSQSYVANYEYNGPRLDVPDTIRVGNEGGSYTVTVRNGGVGEMEMDWYVNDSLSTWVQLVGSVEGVDGDSFTFNYESNPTEARRVDFIEIFAPDSYEMTKRIYIVQMDKPIETTDVSKLDNTIYINPIKTSRGNTTLNIRMKNTAAIRGFQFDLYLPEGVTVLKNNKGKIEGSLCEDRLPEDDEHSLTMTEQDNGCIRFLCGSLYDETFVGTDGDIVSLSINIAENMAEGDYPITIKDIKLTETDISKFYDIACVISKLTISSYKLGDINGDGIVDVLDYIGIANHIMKKTPAGFNSKAADVDDSGVVDVLDYIGIANLIMTGTIYGNKAQSRVSLRGIIE